MATCGDVVKVPFYFYKHILNKMFHPLPKRSVWDMEEDKTLSFQYFDSKKPTYNMLSHISLETGLITAG